MQKVKTAVVASLVMLMAGCNLNQASSSHTSTIPQEYRAGVTAHNIREQLHVLAVWEVTESLVKPPHREELSAFHSLSEKMFESSLVVPAVLNCLLTEGGGNSVSAVKTCADKLPLTLAPGVVLTRLQLLQIESAPK